MEGQEFDFVSVAQAVLRQKQEGEDNLFLNHRVTPATYGVASIWQHGVFKKKIELEFLSSLGTSLININIGAL